jgi:hypothetical protein
MCKCTYVCEYLHGRRKFIRSSLHVIYMGCACMHACIPYAIPYICMYMHTYMQKSLTCLSSASAKGHLDMVKYIVEACGKDALLHKSSVSYLTEHQGFVLQKHQFYVYGCVFNEIYVYIYIYIYVYMYIYHIHGVYM